MSGKMFLESSTRSPLLASPQGGVAERSRNGAKHPLIAKPGWFSDENKVNHPGFVQFGSYAKFLDDAATPPCGDARRGLSRAISSWILLVVLTLAPAAALAQQAAQPKTEEAKKEDLKKEEVKKEEVKKEEPQKQTEEAQPTTEEDSKLTTVPGGKALGMSILGNQEAPKALVIVPWKTSELGNGPSVSMLLDDSKLPVDKEVFMRMLTYYEIRSETARPSGATTNAAAPANTAQRRNP